MSKSKPSPESPESFETGAESEAPRDRGGRFVFFLWGGAGLALVLAGMLPYAEKISWKLVGASVGVLLLAWKR